MGVGRRTTASSETNHSPAVQHFIECLYMDNVHLPADQAFYTELMNELDREDVKPQIYHLLHETGKLVETPIEFQVYLRERQNQVLFQNLFVKRTTEDILRSFDEVGIHAIWLKGTRFAERFFGHYGARATSDVDILIPRAHAELASAVLAKRGYFGPYREMPDHFHDKFVKQTNDISAPLSVELHYDLVRTGAANVDVEALMEHSVPIPGYRFIGELSDQNTFYLMCIHATNHSLNHLKHRLDIIHLLCRKNSNVDLVQLLMKAERDSTVNRIGMALSSVYEELTFLNGVQPLPDKFFVPRTRRNIRLYLVLDCSMLDGWARKIKYLVKWFFPNKVVASLSIGESPDTKKTLVQIYFTLYIRRVKLTVARIWVAIAPGKSAVQH